MDSTRQAPPADFRNSIRLMTWWNCELTSRREDGSFNWKRVDASQPRGVVEAALVPSGAVVGSRVRCETVSNMGRLNVVSCELIDAVDVPTPPSPSPAVTASLAQAPAPRPGHVVWANVLNPLENPDSVGKIRPVVLVSGTATHWRVMGLTTKSQYEGGRPRRPIPDFASVGLRAPGYLWGDKLTRITVESVESFIGFANDQLVDQIIDLARADMSNFEIDDLRSVTRPSERARQAIVRPEGKDPAAPKPTALALTATSILEHIDRNLGTVRDDLRRYFVSGAFTGQHFETYSRLADPRQFDGNDIAAVMCLSVRVSPNVLNELLAFPALGSFSPLDGVRDKPMWHRPASDYEPGSILNRIFDTLVRIENVGPTVASKLMASKFPQSVPVWDRDISLLLGHPEKWWLGWHAAMANPSLRRRLADLRQDLAAEHVPLLRIADVLLWMEARRRKELGAL